jgi:hypothetical protein
MEVVVSNKLGECSFVIINMGSMIPWLSRPKRCLEHLRPCHGHMHHCRTFIGGGRIEKAAKGSNLKVQNIQESEAKK